MDCFIRLERHKNAANALRSNSALWHKLVNFARDMQSGYKEQDSGERLDAACMDPLMRYYFSTIHFTESEITTLMDFPGPTGERAEELFSRMIEANKGVLCTSHTLFPKIVQVYGIPKGILKESSYIKRYEAFNKAWKKEMKKRSK